MTYSGGYLLPICPLLPVVTVQLKHLSSTENTAPASKKVCRYGGAQAPVIRLQRTGPLNKRTSNPKRQPRIFRRVIYAVISMRRFDYQLRLFCHQFLGNLRLSRLLSNLHVGPAAARGASRFLTDRSATFPLLFVASCPRLGLGSCQTTKMICWQSFTLLQMTLLTISMARRRRGSRIASPNDNIVR